MSALLLAGGCAKKAEVAFYICMRDLPARYERSPTGDLNVYLTISKSSSIWNQVATRVGRSDKELRPIHDSLKFKTGTVEQVGDVRRVRIFVTASGEDRPLVGAALGAMISALKVRLAEHQPTVYEAATAQPALDGIVGTEVPYEAATGSRSTLVVYIEP